MSIARRLIGSFGATILGPAVTILIQIINVPVMLRIWGPQLYGEWLMLSAIPTYLLLSDLGFGNVAGSDMTMRVHAGDRDGALETFQSTIALVGASTVILAAVLGLLFFLVPLHRLLHLTALSPAETQWTFFLLSINCLVMLQWSVLMAGYRSTGRYALGMLSTNCIRIIEGAGFLLIVLRRTRPEGLAAFMLLISVVGTLWLALLHHYKAPWLPLGLRAARRTRIRELARPAFAFLAFPTCAAISTQGMTLVAGLVLGPIAVAVFNPMRTLSRIALQLTDAIKNSVWPELSAAFGRNDLALARRLHRSAFQASLVLAGAAILVLALTGPRLFQFWTHGRVTFDLGTFHLLLLAVFANSIWNSSSSVSMSANRHERMSIYYLAFSLGSLAIAVLLSRAIGLRGVALGMLFADAGMALVVVRLSNQILGESFSQFLRGCVDLHELKAVLARVRHKGHAAQSIEIPSP